MNILVIRFRQMGDAIVATPLLSSLRQSFPEAQIHFVLNDRIAPLFEGHPAIDRIITFTNDERHKAFTYLRKVWQTVHQTHYDVIIDMRSTMNTLLFPLFSPSTRFRIGIEKPYSRFILNHRIPGAKPTEGMVEHNLKLAEPLRPLGPLSLISELSLAVTAEEKEDFRQYMISQGVDFSRPIMLVGVTAKLENKTWKEAFMIETIRRICTEWPDLQVVFNFAPGREAENARRIYEAVDNPNIFININAPTMRKLVAMLSLSTIYFGNEGGARHIAQAVGTPSFVICSPSANKATWIPADNPLHQAIAATDFLSKEKLEKMTRQEIYDSITVSRVWEGLTTFCRAQHIL
ncbi:MAG: glycosyltransferase family 9 protein [Bacteroidaceae bacterium]|nr:glycosyltransferase family 9 protein [Bacteroidaceae bacterium]